MLSEKKDERMEKSNIEKYDRNKDYDSVPRLDKIYGSIGCEEYRKIVEEIDYLV